MPRRIPYGPSPEQVGDLWLPDAPGGPLPVVAMWHGGGYVPEVDRTIMEGVARDLCARGVAAWNLEYRRVGSGGGWPQTFADAADGLDRLAELDGELDLGRVVTLGFSAGAPLALWAAGRGDAVVRPVAAVNQAGLTDLAAVARDADLNSSVLIRDLLGDPGENPDALRAGQPDRQPAARPPVAPRPRRRRREHPARTHAALRRARAGRRRRGRVVVIPGATHFDHNDPSSPAWAAVVDWLKTREGGPLAAL